MKQVTIWFDKNLDLHCEKIFCDNSFELAKFKKNDENVLFKASTVIEDNKILLRYNQVTRAGAASIGYKYSSSATVRKHFFRRNMKTIESKIKEYLRKKNYNGSVELRFRIGYTTYEMFNDLGFKVLPGTTERVGGYNYSTYYIVSKVI